MSTISDIQRELGQVRTELRRLEQESRANFGATAVAIRRTRAQVTQLELSRSVEKLRPPTGLLDWRPRTGEPSSPALSDSLLDRLRKGEAVADTIGNAESLIGQTNLLRDPTFEGASSSVAITAVAGQVVPGWEASYVVNSGTPPASVLFDGIYKRGYAPEDNSLNTNIIEVSLSPTTNLYHLDLFLYPQNDFGVGGTPILPYIVASLRMTSFGNAAPASFAIARVRMELVDSISSAVLSASDWLDLDELAGTPLTAASARQIFSSYEPTNGDDLLWMLHIEVQKTGAANDGIEFYFGEPSLHYAYSPDPIPFAPAIGSWIPSELKVHINDEAGPRLRIAGDTIAFGDGSSTMDLELLRSDVATLQLQNNTGVNGAVLEVDGQAAPPANATAGYGKLWWNTGTSSFWQTDSAGTDTDLAGGGGAPATQVSRDAAAAAADYVARIRLTTDTTYRAFLGLDSSDRGALEFGPGGVAARDLGFRRTGTRRLELTGLTSGQTEFALIAPSGQRMKSEIRVAGDAEARLEQWGDATLTGFRAGTGAVLDTRLVRNNPGLWLMDSNNSANPTTLDVRATAGQQTMLRIYVVGDTDSRLELAYDNAQPEILMGSGAATPDIRMFRVNAGTFRVDNNGVAGPGFMEARGDAGQRQGFFVGASGDGVNRIALEVNAAGDPFLEFGPGAAAGRDWRLTRDATNQASLASGDILNLRDAILTLPRNTTALTVTGRVRWSLESDAATGARLLLWDSQRERAVTSDGWTPFAYPTPFEPSLAFTTAQALALSGGSIAIPIEVTGHMLLQSVSYRAQAAGGATEFRLYRQRLNNGGGAENTLDFVTGTNGTAAAPGAAATLTNNIATPGTYLAPGIYWLVIRTTAATAFQLGSTAASAAFAVNTAQTKTLGVALGSTLDFVAATWTKVTAVYAARLNGRVFGQTAAF